MGRRLGQHFLIRSSILERIASAASPKDEELAIEIGAGKGALTEYLLARAARVIAIETDPLLVEHLRRRFSSSSGLTIVESDVLETDLSQWGSAVVAGNLPYYITSPILRKILSLGPRLRQAVLLVQKEVAERLAAKPGSRRYGFLTVETSLYATVEILFTVPPSAFRPSPKVESAVVRLRPSSSAASLGIEDPAKFLHFVGLSFHQKRKTIRNNLAGHYGRTLLDSRPEASLRAEQLSLAQFAQLFHDLEQGCAANL